MGGYPAAAVDSLSNFPIMDYSNFLSPSSSCTLRGRGGINNVNSSVFIFLIAVISQH